jgi:hypothetical protein
MEGGSASQLFMACGASGHPSASCQKASAGHSWEQLPSNQSSLNHPRYQPRPWGDGICSPGGVVDDLGVSWPEGEVATRQDVNAGLRKGDATKDQSELD